MPAFDPLSVLIAPDPQSNLVRHSLLLRSFGGFANLNSPSTEFVAYGNRMVVSPQRFPQWQLAFSHLQQQYRHDLARENYQLTALESQIAVRWQQGAQQVQLASDGAALQLGTERMGVQWRLWLHAQSQDLLVDIDSQSLDVQQRMHFSFSDDQCGGAAVWQRWQLVVTCRWDDELTFAGSRLNYDGDPWQFSAAWEDSTWHAADQWQLNDEAMGDSEINWHQQRLVLAAGYRDWLLRYQYRTVDGDMLTKIDVQNELLVGVGKGRYLVTGQADFRQHVLAATLPSWRSRWGQLSTQWDLSYMDDIRLQANVYEPLLFLGLPVLTDSRSAPVTALGVAVARIGWQTPLRAGWQLDADISQIIPWYIEQPEHASDSSGEDSSDSGGSNPDAGGSEQRGWFWPGFAIRAGLTLRY